MLGFDLRAARYTWTAAMVVLLVWLVYDVHRTLFVFILAVLFAYLLSPLVNLLNRAIPGRTRVPALALAYIIFVAVVVILGIQIGTRVVEQATTLVKNLPSMMASLEQPSPKLSPEINSLKAAIAEKVRTELLQAFTLLLSALPQAGLKFLTVASELIYVVIIPILAFFFLKDGSAMRDNILDLVDAGPRRALLEDVLADLNLLLAHYMRALVLLSLACFTAYSVFFSILGLPYSVLLGALGGALEFIPTLGPLTAVIVIVLVSAVSGANLIPVLIFLVAYRMFQDYFLSPRLMGQGVELHPLLVLFGVFAGAEVAGVPGTFLSVPVLAMVRIVYLRITKARLVARPGPAEKAPA
jgi:predicted PurR-regulated permease PerM